jgi:CheY-like chemotaxis protein
MSKALNFPASRELFQLARTVADKLERGALDRLSDAEIGKFIGFESARTSRWKHGQIAVQDSARLIALSQALDIDLTVLAHVASGALSAEEALDILSSANRLVRFLGEQMVLPEDNQGLTMVSDSTRFKIIRRSPGHYRRQPKRIGREGAMDSDPDHEPTVLLVDDSNSTIRYFRNLTGSGTGFSGIIARTGPEALIAAGKTQPQLVIFDLFIGQIDGFAAVKSIVESDATKEAEVFATSLSLDGEIVRAALGAGAVEVIRRPLHSKVLTALLHRTR